MILPKSASYSSRFWVSLIWPLHFYCIEFSINYRSIYLHPLGWKRELEREGRGMGCWISWCNFLWWWKTISEGSLIHNDTKDITTMRQLRPASKPLAIRIKGQKSNVSLQCPLQNLLKASVPYCCCCCQSISIVVFVVVGFSTLHCNFHKLFFVFFLVFVLCTFSFNVFKSFPSSF